MSMRRSHEVTDITGTHTLRRSPDRQNSNVSDSRLEGENDIAGSTMQLSGAEEHGGTNRVFSPQPRRIPVGVCHPRRRTGPARPSPPREVRWPGRGSRPLGSGGDHPGLQEGRLAFLGPAGHGLGRHVQEVGHLGGPEIARVGGCGLAARSGCHGASLSCHAANPGSDAGPDGDRVVRPTPTVKAAAPTVPRCGTWCWTTSTIIETRPSTPP
jgi:hypothetical protein